MNTTVADVLHDIHTATNDVIEGYREMAARAEPEIQLVVQRLLRLHERHAAELADALQRLRETTAGDSSLQGSVNKAVVILRDWFTDLDRDVLPAVRQGEEALRDELAKALREPAVQADTRTGQLLQAQRDAVAAEIAALPRDAQRV